MTASTPWRSASSCQSETASPPRYVTARSASRSSSEPGKVMTPTRAELKRSLLHFLRRQKTELLDDRIGKELLGHRLDLRESGDLVVGLHHELDVFADTNGADVIPAHSRKRTLDGLALRVEKALLKRNDDLVSALHYAPVAPDRFR